MGCGASKKGAVCEPQAQLAPLDPNACASLQRAVPAAAEASGSPNSTRMSGASTPMLGASWRGPDGEAAESERGEEDDAAGSTKIELDGPSLQDRVDLLEQYVQTQNFGKTARAAFVPDADGDESEACDDMGGFCSWFCHLIAGFYCGTVLTCCCFPRRCAVGPSKGRLGPRRVMAQ